MMRKTRTRKIELLYKNVGSNDWDKAWKFWKILSLVPHPCTTCVGWAWDHGFEMCESTSYNMRVDATSFRSLFLIISTLVVGESWRLAPLPIWRYIYRWCLGRESWEDLWLTRDVDHCWAGIINCTNPCWVSWRFWRFSITISQKYQIPTFYCIDEEDYNNLFHMSKKTMWKCQI